MDAPDSIGMASKAPGPLTETSGFLTGLLSVDNGTQLTRVLSTETLDVAMGGDSQLPQTPQTPQNQSKTLPIKPIVINSVNSTITNGTNQRKSGKFSYWTTPSTNQNVNNQNPNKKTKVKCIG